MDNNNNEIEDGEIFSNSDNDEKLENGYNTTSSSIRSLLPTFIKKDEITGVDKNCIIMENNHIDRKRSHECSSSSMNSNSFNEINQQFDDKTNIFVRGGLSPLQNQQNNYYENSTLYYDDISYDSEENYDNYLLYERKKRRKNKRYKIGSDKYKNKNQRNKNINGYIDQVVYKRKKLCKFFLQNKCYRPSQCVFMHGEFPCKYYYLGLKCPDNKNCKLDHGKPLNDEMKEALLRHIQYAPDECLGNFTKLPTEVADKLFADRAVEIALKENILKENTLEELKLENACFDDTTVQSNNKNCTILLNQNQNKMLQEKITLNDRNIDDFSLKASENLTSNFKDIDDRMKENFKKTIESENYSDHNLKFLLIQFFLSLNRNDDNSNINDIPQSLNIENYNEFLTEIQIEKLKELGINFVHHLSLLSLANLNTLGISITKITQIQDKALNFENINESTTNIEQFDNKQIISSTTYDTDMRILPPVYNINKWLRTDTDCRFLTQLLDDNQTESIMDEESELVIDESNLSDVTSDDISCDDSNLIDYDVNVSNKNLEKEVHLNVDMENDEKSEQNTNDYVHTFLHLMEKNIKQDILTIGDMDMRLQFVSTAKFLPATEINASINLHQDIEFEVKEIFIPEKNGIPVSVLANLDPNHPDPRIRKEFSKREHSNNNKTDFFTNFNTNELHNDKTSNKKENNKYNMEEKENILQNITSKILSPNIGTDPRKRFDSHSTILEPLIVHHKPNNNSDQLLERNTNSSIKFLQSYLHKSQWYHDQNSKRKIEINDLIAILNKSIKCYHKENLPNKKFLISNLYCGQKIKEILNNLGIGVNFNGDIVEINKLIKNNEQDEQINDENNINCSNIDNIFKNNTNFINNNNNANPIFSVGYSKPPPLLPSLELIPPLSPILKPGLLGFAPGMPCDDNSNHNISSSIFSPSASHYYPKFSQDPNYINSHSLNFQRKYCTNFCQRNYRKMNDRI